MWRAKKHIPEATQTKDASTRKPAGAKKNCQKFHRVNALADIVAAKWLPRESLPTTRTNTGHSIHDMQSWSLSQCSLHSCESRRRPVHESDVHCIFSLCRAGLPGLLSPFLADRERRRTWEIAQTLLQPGRAGNDDETGKGREGDYG